MKVSVEDRQRLVEWQRAHRLCPGEWIAHALWGNDDEIERRMTDKCELHRYVIYQQTAVLLHLTISRIDAHRSHIGTAIKHPGRPGCRHLQFLTSGHSDAQGWTSECPDVKNYKWQLGLPHDALSLCTYGNSGRQRVKQRSWRRNSVYSNLVNGVRTYNACCGLHQMTIVMIIYLKVTYFDIVDTILCKYWALFCI